jgi:hypothetical protein
MLLQDEILPNASSIGLLARKTKSAKGNLSPFADLLIGRFADF